MASEFECGATDREFASRMVAASCGGRVTSVSSNAKLSWPVKGVFCRLSSGTIQSIRFLVQRVHGRS